MIEVGPYRFAQCNVAFHCQRTNVYSPWTVIGLCVTGPGFARARYLKNYSHFADAFDKEVSKVDSEYILGGPEFIDWWRLQHQEATSVITPVITYYTKCNGESREVFFHLFSKYVGNISPISFLNLAMMLKMKDGYFASIFRDHKDREPLKAVLREASLI